MKRWIGGIVTLVCICCILGMSGRGLAAGNAFVDIPANHWAYTAITKLAQDGVLQGYRNTDYQGDKAITRYEMAMLVANAMGRIEKANADDQAIRQGAHVWSWKFQI
ncbi:MAG: S-layer protein [Firmicutes bacterium]|nr:S-layer protein [Bacillota bacterium]